MRCKIDSICAELKNYLYFDEKLEVGKEKLKKKILI